MPRPVRLARILGVPVTLRPSLFLALLMALFVAGWAGVAIALVAFASVLVHELGHAAVARRRDVRVGGIELHFFGGAARLLDAPRTPRDEIAIAAAGPAVSLALGGAAALAAWATGSWTLATLGWINLALGAFNLLPALPMDGGRILRAILARRMSFARATRVAVTTARWVAGGLAVFGALQGSLYLIVLAGVVWMLGTRELWAATIGASRYRQAPAVEVLPRDWPFARARRAVIVDR
jgi:Zn-dependent protease